jgi:Domain of unknown function (DUF4190)
MPTSPSASPDAAAARRLTASSPGRRTNDLAILSLGLGIFWLGGIGSLLALILGFVARSQIKRGDEGGGRLAVTGIVLGILGLLVAAAYLLS